MNIDRIAAIGDGVVEFLGALVYLSQPETRLRQAGMQFGGPLEAADGFRILVLACIYLTHGNVSVDVLGIDCDRVVDDIQGLVEPVLPSER